MDEDRPLDERLQAFANRADWLEPLGLDKGYTHQINHMIHHFDQMGVREERPGLPGEPNFPDVMQVSDQPGRGVEAEVEAEDRIARRQTAVRDGDEGAPDLGRIEKVRRFPGGLTRPRTA